MFLPLIDGVFHATVLSLAWERMISNSRMGNWIRCFMRQL